MIEQEAPRRSAAKPLQSGAVHAPMPGLITDIFVQPGQFVQQGDKLVVLEAMKTRQAFSAPFAGIVAKVVVQPKDQVAEGQLLLLVVPEIEGAVAALEP